MTVFKLGKLKCILYSICQEPLFLKVLVSKNLLRSNVRFAGWMFSVKGMSCRGVDEYIVYNRTVRKEK